MGDILTPNSESQQDGEQIPVRNDPDDQAKLNGAEGSFYHKIFGNEKLIVALIRTGYGFLIFAVIILLFAFFVYAVPAMQEMPGVAKTTVTNSAELMKNAVYKKQIAQVKRDIQRLSRKYNSYTSGQSYLVINTTDNLFYLYRNKKLVREGHCSTGSYKLLKTEEGRSWIFKTPKGRFWIQGKTTNPSWRRPDWSFVEEGLPIPPENDYSRYEYGVLGDYAMALGDGYLIHGTIYKRFLGMPVTHGCVRLNDEDLEVIFNTLSIGSKVYIF
jgi:lipoprotein-anchoring transpeptidase ErfK/SrfK